VGADFAVSGQVLQVAWYRFTPPSPQWGGYLSIVLLIGLTADAMGSIAAARRTQSSFATSWPAPILGHEPRQCVAPVLTNDWSGYLAFNRPEARCTSTLPLARTGAAIIPPSYVDDEVTASAASTASISTKTASR